MTALPPPADVLSFAIATPKLIKVTTEMIGEVSPVVERFHTLNYPEEANEQPHDDWHPHTLIARGLVLHETTGGDITYALIPHVKFFGWPAAETLPETVTFHRKVDGSCVHATVLQ